MLRSILIGLDNSVSGIWAQELAIRWAKQYEARVVGLAIVDDLGISTEALATFEDASYRRVGTSQAVKPRLKASEVLRQAIRRFETRCRESGVDVGIIETVGSPHLQILAEAQKHDVILLGQKSCFAYGYEGEPGQTLGKVIQDSPRPVVAVPETGLGGESVVIAYDGSLQASRALSAFEAIGLGRSQPLHVVCVDVDGKDGAAERRMDDALGLLTSHGARVIPHLVKTSLPPAQTILSIVKRTDAGLLVMGAYGQSALHEFFLGSVTRTLLEKSSVPLFVYH